MSEENNINEELELYKLIKDEEYECGWVSDKEFFVWLRFSELSDFVTTVEKIFGNYVLENEGMEIRLLQDSICIDLNVLLGDYEIYLERVFPRDEFKH